MLSLKPNARFKEAFKVGLAFALVYGIALKLSWMNPSWAGYGVAMIALATAGQSIHKGLERLAGTIPGCLSALLILALAPQSRWLFILLTASWVFFTVYMMIRSRDNPYFWNVAGFVCLVILLTGPGSSANDFEHAIFRTLETALGIGVYTLVTVFIWPSNNAGNIRRSIAKLAATLQDRNQAIWSVMSGGQNRKEVQDLHKQSVQLLHQLSEALIAEGSENYEVAELRPSLERFRQLAELTMASQDRLENGLDDMIRINLVKLLPGLQSLMQDQNMHLEEIQLLLKEQDQDQKQYQETAPACVDLNPHDFDTDKDAVSQLNSFDLASLVLTKNELQNFGSLVTDMLKCIRDIQLGNKLVEPSQSSGAGSAKTGFSLPTLDRDHFKGALFASLCCITGFLIWIFINPPGHAAWLELPAIAAMGVAVTQQTRMTILFKPFAVMLTVSLAVYVLILPQLSNFIGLGLLLFLCVFFLRYFYSGIAQLAGMVAIINMISIQNQQTYNFAAQANALVFTLMVFLLVFVASYLLGSSRPEKAWLKMMRRFFTSAQFMVAHVAGEPGRKVSWFEQWKISYYRNEMESLPGKIEAWGKTINHSLFPGTTQAQLENLVTSLQSLVYRINALLLSSSNAISETTVRSDEGRELVADFNQWLQKIEYILNCWSSRPDALIHNQQQQGIKSWLNEFESRIQKYLARVGSSISEQDSENFIRLLGGFRGVSSAAKDYAKTARHIDWTEMREERFS